MKNPRKADKSGFIRLENRLYRLPDACRLQEVRLRVSSQTLEVFCGQKPIIRLDKTADAYAQYNALFIGAEPEGVRP